MELEDLLAPISEAAPGGSDMSLSPEVDVIQELRREDDPTLDQGEWVAHLKVADWPGAARACEQLLRQQSKDLRVAGWCAEALAHTQGFEGLARGLTLCAGLIEHFWTDLHPLIEDGDLEPRVGNLRWLNSKVEEQARRIPLLPRAVLGGRPVSLLDVEAARARRLAGEPEPASTPNAAEAPPGLDAIVRGLAQAGLRAHEAQAAAVASALAAWEHLVTLADQALGEEAPSFADARRALDSAQDALQRLARDAGLTGPSGTATEGPALAPSEATRPGLAAMPMQAMAAGPIQSRAQALEQLRQVAEYFRVTEPHSPVAYLADKAARWGTMPLHDWLRTVLKDPGALAHVEELLGVERREEPGY
ncbi:type VI secretion system protein TssA [Ideonella oryzae]|uniref:Type VI secretion system protein TssA n=1 Tax=Ideonella oryzae TaxID=2937441 RepID=A0ABT1BJF3_9BURK|nr:type VI secretion system protein TssA [Ideonella oryzae]MCO5975742.1 type VI secretion system protein TssA [Ideonella oryzae]